MANEISISITALNAASPELAKLQKDVEAATKAVQDSAKVVGGAGAKGMKDLSDSIRPVLAATHGMATQIAGTLNPALGNMAGGLGLVARGAGAMGLALGGATAAVVVGGAAFKNYLDVQREVAATQAKLNLLARSFDLSGAKSMVAGFSLELDTLDQRATGLTGRWVTGWRRITDALGQTVDATKALAAAQAAVEAVVPAERRRGLAEQRALQIEAFRARQDVGLRRAEAQGNLADFEEIAARMQREQLAQGVAILEVIRSESERDFAAALATHQPASELSRITELGAERMKTFQAQRNVAQAAFAEQFRRRRLGIVGVTEAVSAEPRALAEEEEGFAIGQRAIRDMRREGAVQANELLAAEIALRKEAVGLTRDQRLELTLKAIQQDRSSAFAQAEGKANQDHLKALAEVQAAWRTTIELEQHAEKTNPLAGFARGMQDVVDAWTASGTLMRDTTQNIASDMASAMSDSFFNVVTGQFSKLSDVSRQFGLNIIRTLTDTLSKAAVGSILKDFLANSGLGGGQGFVRGLGLLGAGMSPGGLVEVGGQLFQSVAAGGGQTVLVPMAAGPAGGASVAASMAGIGGRAAGGGMGGAGGFLSLFSDATSAIRVFLNTPLSSVAPSLFGASTLAPSVAAGATASELAALGATGAEIQAATAGAGATIGTALGAVGAIAGLAFTVYSGLTGPPTAQNIATGAVSGALSGAILGSLVYPGVGTVIGAVAGAALGGGAAAMGKEDPAIKKQRQQAEINRAVGAGSALGSAVQATQSIEELFTLLAKHGSGYTGGTSAVAIATQVFASGQPNVGPPLIIGFPNSLYRVATLEEFVQFGPTSLTVGIQAGVNQAELSGPNQDLAMTIRNKIRQLVQALSQIELSISDLLASPFGGNVQRTTTFRADQIGAFAGQELRVEGPSLNGLTPEQRVAFLKQLAKDDYDHNLNILYRDPATDEIVSISRTPFSGDVVRA